MPTAAVARMALRCSVSTVGDEGWFPSFLPKEVERIRDPSARRMARRIERLPVQISSSESCIMSTCVKPLVQSKRKPLVLLHGFDSSCLEWRYTYPLLEDAGLETWAVDILGWGFSDLERLPSCDVASKREHLYQLWKSYIKKPMVLVGPSLGSAVAIDFAFNYSEAVEKLVLIDASVYAEGTGNMKTLPKIVAYAGVSLLKSIPLRLYANYLAVNHISFSTRLDWTNLKQKTLIIWGEDDQIISNKLALRLHDELPNSVLHQIPNCGHLPHVEKPEFVAQLIVEFVRGDLKNQ
ncbi:alpha/beta hydrolase domain-containing protein VTE7 isoform X2 [Magnolia sinica]|uniref:alpha/beta hydrolase domain-containing protein VTE7 isoform X2 n=1 Tax=Magnolia sinica TaxID=86752 RepID=UPI002658563C|nr:alpha/beta hydrolase domain-containing protein VTE7 isoform X2 [Magnolia sinica]